MFITFCPKWYSLVGFRASNHFVNSKNLKKRRRRPDPVFLAGKYNTCVECSKVIFPRILCNTNSILQLPSLLKRWENCGQYFGWFYALVSIKVIFHLKKILLSEVSISSVICWIGRSKIMRIKRPEKVSSNTARSQQQDKPNIAVNVIWRKDSEIR